LFAGLVLAALAILITGYRNATRPPLVRRLTVELPAYPAAAAPLRIVLLSDVHVHGPDMPPQRLARIVDQINALHPDIAIAAGDFVGDNWIGRHYSPGEAIAPLRGLKARLGVYAVLGNNDYRAVVSDVVRALQQAGVHVLMNSATAVGPLALGGMDGRLYATPADLRAARRSTYGALERTPGIKVLVAHRPDEFAAAPQAINLVLAGHTHCGQIVLPLIGAVLTGSDYGRKYLCGVVRDRTRVLVVTAGLGTSYVPLRIGAPPDIWMISIRNRSASQG
jgi:predicted MPP superfamily phosphohydrolase